MHDEGRMFVGVNNDRGRGVGRPEIPAVEWRHVIEASYDLWVAPIRDVDNDQPCIPVGDIQAVQV